MLHASISRMLWRFSLENIFAFMKAFFLSICIFSCYFEAFKSTWLSLNCVYSTIVQLIQKYFIFPNKLLIPAHPIIAQDSSDFTILCRWVSQLASSKWKGNLSSPSIEIDRKSRFRPLCPTRYDIWVWCIPRIWLL